VVKGARFSFLRHRGSNRTVDVCQHGHRRIYILVFIIILAFSLTFFLSSVSRSQQIAQDQQFEALLGAYTRYEANLEQTTHQDDDAIQKLAELEDRLLKAAERVPQSARQKALLAIANARFDIDHRDPIPIIEAGLVANDTIAARLALSALPSGC